jgi:hypothetical protein
MTTVMTAVAALSTASSAGVSAISAPAKPIIRHCVAVAFVPTAADDASVDHCKALHFP